MRSFLFPSALLVGAALFFPGGAASAGDAKSPPTFKWSEAPTIDQAPGSGVHGVVNGASLVFDNIAITAEDAHYNLEVRANKDHMSAGPRIALAQAPAAGTTQSHKMADSAHGTFLQAPDPSRGPTATTSWNTATAWTVQIAKWDVKPWSAATKNQVAGTASGKFVIVFKGGSGFKDSWVAGTFTDVPVKYSSSPPLCAATCEDLAAYNPRPIWPKR